VSWVLAFAGFAVLVILHELGHFAVAKWVGMRVEKFSLFFPPTVFSRKVGETEYAIGSIPLGGYVRISGMNPAEDLPDEVRDRAYHSAPVWKRVAVIAAGPAVNLVLAFVLLLAFFSLIGSQTATDRVGSIEKGYPAAAALKAGDRLLSVDGIDGTTREMSQQIARHKCGDSPPTDGCRATTPATLVIARDGRRVTERLTPIYDERNERTRLGFSYALGERDTLPLGESVATSAESFWLVTRETLKLPATLIDSEKRKDISGVVGTYETTRQVALIDVAQVIQILAIISLSLAIINLFPFLPLDGGHIFWAIVEKLRGRPVPFAVMERAGVIGFMLVIGLFAIGLTNDIGRLQGEGFGIR
jgi:regulator of sigma E protease